MELPTECVDIGKQMAGILNPVFGNIDRCLRKE